MTAVWLATIRLGDVWKNPELSFEERRDAIVSRIKSSNWYGEGDDLTLADIVDGLSEAEDADDFDDAWDALYDLADEDRVWIDLW